MSLDGREDRANTDVFATKDQKHNNKEQLVERVQLLEEIVKKLSDAQGKITTPIECGTYFQRILVFKKEKTRIELLM